TYDDVEHAPTVLLAGLEPEEESPILLLRLRKAAAKLGTQGFSVGPWASPALTKVKGRLIPTAPGGEARLLNSLATGAHRLGRTGGGAGRRPRACVPRARSSSWGNDSRLRPARCRRPSPWLRRPGPSWRGCRAARATG